MLACFSSRLVLLAYLCGWIDSRRRSPEVCSSCAMRISASQILDVCMHSLDASILSCTCVASLPIYFFLRYASLISDHFLTRQGRRTLTPRRRFRPTFLRIIRRRPPLCSLRGTDPPPRHRLALGSTCFPPRRIARQVSMASIREPAMTPNNRIAAENRCIHSTSERSSGGWERVDLLKESQALTCSKSQTVHFGLPLSDYGQGMRKSGSAAEGSAAQPCNCC
ncbi:hypothetical protein C8R43DRAFT_441970 [Mycena crocata]|nr:hypothetical protein C8R43DRAFT_441970 [Mycena crocata]